MPHGEGICKCHTGMKGRKIKSKHGPGICKCEYHQTRYNLYRDDFLAKYGQGPYPCGWYDGWGCGEPVLFEDADIDHVNGDHRDNSLENLQPMHRKCHARKSAITDGRGSRVVGMQAHENNSSEARSKRAKEQWRKRKEQGHNKL